MEALRDCINAPGKFSANRFAERHRITKGFSTCLKLMGLTESQRGGKSGSVWVGEKPSKESELLLLAQKVREFTLNRQVTAMNDVSGLPTYLNRETRVGRRANKKDTAAKWIFILNDIGENPYKYRGIDVSKKYAVGSGFVSSAIGSGVLDRRNDGTVRLRYSAGQKAVSIIRKYQHALNTGEEKPEPVKSNLPPYSPHLLAIKEAKKAANTSSVPRMPDADIPPMPTQEVYMAPVESIQDWSKRKRPEPPKRLGIIRRFFQWLW